MSLRLIINNLKNRANIAASILQNGDMLRSVYESSRNSEGSAEIENEKYMNSIAGKLQELQNQIQKFVSLTLDSDVFKGLIDGANALLTIINELIEKAGLIPVLLTGVGGFKFYKNMGSLSEIGRLSSMFGGFGKNVSKMDNKDEMVKSFIGLVNAENSPVNSIDELNELLMYRGVDAASTFRILNGSRFGKDFMPDIKKQIEEAASIEEVNKIFKKNKFSADNAKTLLGESEKWSGSLENVAKEATETSGAMTVMEAGVAGLATSETAATTSTVTFGSALSGLGSIIMANIGWIAAFVAAGAGIYAVYKYVNRYNDALKKTGEAVSDYKNSAGETQELQEKIDSLGESIDDLKQKAKDGTITLAEEGQLRLLEQQTAELERQRELKQIEEDKARNEAIKAANESLGLKTTNDLSSPKDTRKYIDEYGNELNISDGYNTTDIMTATSNDLEMIKELRKEREKLLNADVIDQVALDENEKHLNQLLDDVKDNAKELEKHREAFVDPLTGLAHEDLSEGDMSTYNELTRLIDGVNNLNKSEEEIISNQLDKLFSNDSKGVAELRKEIVEAYNSGEDLSSILEKVGFDINSLPAEQVAYVNKYFEQMAKEVDVVAEKLQLTSLSLEELANDSESNLSKMISSFTTESKENGDYYNDILGYIKTAEELYKNGDIGTNKFKSIAKFFSPNGFEDEENWKENLSTIKRYFTENNDGAINFLNDLKKNGYAWEENGEYRVKNFIDADKLGKKLGIGSEAITVMLGNLMDKGLSDNLFTDEQGGFSTLLSLEDELAQKQRELNELMADKSASKSAIKDKQKEVQNLKKEISDTKDGIEDMYDAYENGGKGDFVDKEGAKDYLSRYNALNNTYSSSSDEATRNGWEKNRSDLAAQAKQYAEANGLKVGFNKYAQAVYAKNDEELNKKLDASNEKTENFAKLIDEAKTAQGDDLEDIKDEIKKEAKKEGLTAKQFEQIYDSKNQLTDTELADFGNVVNEELDAEQTNTEALQTLTDAINALCGILDPSYKPREEANPNKNKVQKNKEDRANQSNKFSPTSRIENLSTGESYRFDGSVNGKDNSINAYKEVDGTITYTAVVDGVEKEVEKVDEKDGTITYKTKIEDGEGKTKSKNKNGGKLITKAEIDETKFKKDAKYIENKTKELNGMSMRPDVAIEGLSTATRNINSLINTIERLPSSKTVKINYQKKTSGSLGKTGSGDSKGHEPKGNFNGTFHAPAHAQGTDVSIQQNERALINELGEEIVV